MKTNVLRNSILALVAAAAGYAQSPTTTVRANIPFNFVAGDKSLSAGQYTVDRTDAPGVIVVKSARPKATTAMAAAIGQCTGAPAGAELVFHRYGDVYLLSQVWPGGGECGRAVTVTDREREIVAQHRTPEETVIVAMR
jgi:hypothetical protein